MKKTKERGIKLYRKLSKVTAMIMIVVVMVGIMGISDVKTSAATSITISNTSLTMKKGTTFKLALSNLPSKTAKVTWSTSNYFAATVAADGTVKAENYGTAVITAKCKKQTVSCKIYIPDTSRTVTLNTPAITLPINGKYQLVASSAKPVSYGSYNKSIANVDANGVITAYNPGQTVIIAKSSTGYAACQVTVTDVSTTPTQKAWVTNKKARGIRRMTKSGNMKYETISWASGKTINFKISNVNINNVKKCVWRTDNKTILSRPKKNGSKIQATAKTLTAGYTKVSATVTYASGKVKTYRADVYVTSPKVSTKTLYAFMPTIGNNRQQYASITGLSPYSKITWTNSDSSVAKTEQYGMKLAVWGLKEGTCTLKAKVDGKTRRINVVVLKPVFNKIRSVVAVNYTTKINVQGLSGIVPFYESRNTTIAQVDQNGTITGKKAGVTYVDVHIGNMMYTYRVEIAAKGIRTIIKRADYIVNNWQYSQGKRMQDGYYDCSSLVWKGYKAYKKYHSKLGSTQYALPAAYLFDYLESKNQIVYYGYTCVNDLTPGDLIFYGDYNNAVKYSTPGRTLNIYHVAMYAGNGRVVEKGGQPISYNGTNYIVGIGRVVK